MKSKKKVTNMLFKLRLVDPDKRLPIVNNRLNDAVDIKSFLTVLNVIYFYSKLFSKSINLNFKQKTAFFFFCENIIS